jgi:hypothetical protein
MSRLLEHAIAEIESERRWDDLFSQPSAAIECMAAEALEEHRAGKTMPLDPDSL